MGVCHLWWPLLQHYYITIHHDFHCVAECDFLSFMYPIFLSTAARAYKIAFASQGVVVYKGSDH